MDRGRDQQDPQPPGGRAGPLSSFGVLIKAGLKAGEWIVIKGVHSVDAGDQVEIIDASKEGTPS